jgi:hypothetical protein
MATTQYQIFCRYLNETVNCTLTNKTDVEWIGAEELMDLEAFINNKEKKQQYDEIIQRILDGTTKVNELNVQEYDVYSTGKRYDEVQSKIKSGKIVQEYCILEPADSLGIDKDGKINSQYKKEQAARDLALYDKIIEESRATNPKYDMVFMYDGIGYVESHTGEADYHPAKDDDKQVPYVYYERMKRVKLDPWFLFSTHASLTSAMIKAKELINILGKDAVKIGKVVPLEQYIEIV